jgi:hypothetical protein
MQRVPVTYVRVRIVVGAVGVGVVVRIGVRRAGAVVAGAVVVALRDLSVHFTHGR